MKTPLLWTFLLCISRGQSAYAGPTPPCDLAVGAVPEGKVVRDEVLCVWSGESKEKKGCLMGIYSLEKNEYVILFPNGSLFGGITGPCSKDAVLRSLRLPKTSYAVGATPTADVSVWLYFMNRTEKAFGAATLRALVDRFHVSKDLGLPLKLSGRPTIPME